MLATVVFVGIFICLVELPAMRKRGQKKELLVFYVLLIFGMSAGIVKALHGSWPNPLEWITFIFKPVSDLMIRFLG